MGARLEVCWSPFPSPWRTFLLPRLPTPQRIPQAIHGFRETEKSRWSEASRAILQRVQAAAFGPGQALLSPVHVLDLEPQGYIKPHVDSIKFCGDTIAGLSLLSPSVMRLVHTQDAGQWLELLLEPGSLYILRGSARYDFSHEILRDEESFFGEHRVPRGRRISVICRSLPEGMGPGKPGHLLPASGTPSPPLASQTH
ncbi:PREDICTED: alpha-ketoglutarate-dependent dioxygenase alkB homolog 7, mitochondrial [Condylura cristata]|uniref:alpha-ketoglutarate-dependent dioxygenase alkB homolog 7, mitochondrial n=1 Tax=Condylura cristata TaxID=143302 RepID=UPI000642CAA7|nr:PREDICTED: alpha-ketoglutarate-dependent dioxygenase alkB homolog 7, mitochondrial [Condylura cristata]